LLNKTTGWNHFVPSRESISWLGLRRTQQMTVCGI